MPPSHPDRADSLEVTAAEITDSHDMATWVPHEELSEAQMKGSKIVMSKYVYIKKWHPDARFDRYKCKIIPVIHPSALLRGSRQINSTVEALHRIKIAAQSTVIPAKTPVEYVLVDTWEMALWV